MMSEPVPRPLGSQYRLDRLIGRGGMGEVWHGHDAVGHEFAFKLLAPHVAQDVDIVERFVAERRLLVSVSHPNVVQVHDMVVEGGTIAIVMDFVSGADLREYLRAHGTLSQAEACRVGAEIAAGLSAIHVNRIVHRDIKPENVLLDQTSSAPRVRLTDFGVARIIEEGPAQSTPTALAGTPVYMAPEIIRGGAPIPQSDLYSLGILLYELACGVTPFAGRAPAAVMQGHLTLLPGRPAGLDDRLWTLLSSVLAKSPVERPLSAAAAEQTLRALATSLEGIPALEPLSVPPPGVTAQLHPRQSAAAWSADVTQLAAPSPGSSWSGSSWPQPASSGMDQTILTPPPPARQAPAAWDGSATILAASPIPSTTPGPQPTGLTASPSRGGRSRGALVAAIVGVGVLALAVIAGVLVFRSKDRDEAEAGPAVASAASPTSPQPRGTHTQSTSPTPKETKPTAGTVLLDERFDSGGLPVGWDPVLGNWRVMKGRLQASTSDARARITFGPRAPENYKVEALVRFVRVRDARRWLNIGLDYHAATDWGAVLVVRSDTAAPDGVELAQRAKKGPRYVSSPTAAAPRPVGIGSDHWVVAEVHGRKLIVKIDGRTVLRASNMKRTGGGFALVINNGAYQFDNVRIIQLED